MKEESHKQCSRCHFNEDCPGYINIHGLCGHFCEHEDPFLAALFDEMDYGTSKIGRELP